MHPCNHVTLLSACLRAMLHVFVSDWRLNEETVSYLVCHQTAFGLCYPYLCMALPSFLLHLSTCNTSERLHAAKNATGI